MLQLYIPEKVCLYHSFKEAENELHFSHGDLILTSSALAKKYLKSSDCSFLIVTMDKDLHDPCNNKTFLSLKKQIPDGIKRFIVWGSPVLLDYGKLLYADMRKKQRKIPFILISFECDAGSEMLTRVTLANSADHTLSEKHTSPADYICLYPEIPDSDAMDSLIAGTINSLIYASETFIHEKATNHTLLFSREALCLLIKSYRRIVFQNAKPDAELCQNFILAGNYTGIAREQIKESLLEPLFQKLPSDIRDHCHIRLLIFIHLFRRHVFTSPTGRIQEYLSYMSSLLNCSRSNVYPELLNLVKCVLPPSGELNLPAHLREIEKLVSTL